jgi:porin
MRYGVIVALMLIAAPASAEELPAALAEPTVSGKAAPSSSAETSSVESAPSSGDPLSFLRGQRRQLEELGITFKLNEQSEVWGDVMGGGRRGTSYDGLTEAKLDIDLAKAAGWSGAEFLVNAYDIHGHGPTRSLVGNLQIVSSLEATPSVKLYDLWLDQSLFDKRLSVRLGQEGANDELMVTQYGGLFLNSSFGFPGMAALVLPSGGPNYPMATPFARVNFQATDNWKLIAAVYNGDPAPPGGGDPQIRDRNGTAFRLNGHTLSFGEIWYSPDPKAPAGLPTTYKLGAWYATNQFADQRFDSAGGLLANPAGTGQPLQHTGDWTIYGVIDQMIWRRDGTKDQGIGVFFHAMYGPGDRNLSNFFVEGGMNWRAPFASREDDVFGVAFSYLGISPAARYFSRDLIAFGGTGPPYAPDETVVEATYQAPITSYLTLQPDIQLVLNPGAGIPGPFGHRTLATAIVIGTRATIRF